MGRDIVFLRAKKPTEEEETDEDYYEKRVVASVSLGSGDAWPCYLRPLFIAAYVRQNGGDPDDPVMQAILKCCPPDHSTIDNTRQSCGFFGHAPRDFGVFSGQIKARHNMIDETELFRAENQILVAKAGLWPCVELLLMHHRCPFTTPTIRRVSEMMQLLKAYVPYEEKDLEYAEPYADVESDYNLADDRWKDLIEAFELAASEDDIIGLVE